MANMTLGEARGFLGWTQTQLAKEAGIGLSTINELENGGNKNPGYRLVMKIVKALQRGGLSGVKAEDIFPVAESKGRVA